jgi:hypothetical protein
VNFSRRFSENLEPSIGILVARSPLVGGNIGRSRKSLEELVLKSCNSRRWLPGHLVDAHVVISDRPRDPRAEERRPKVVCLATCWRPIPMIRRTFARSGPWGVLRDVCDSSWPEGRTESRVLLHTGTTRPRCCRVPFAEPWTNEALRPRARHGWVAHARTPPPAFGRPLPKGRGGKTLPEGRRCPKGG